MMPVVPAPEPPEFNEQVRVPGLRSIYEKCGQPVPVPYKRAKGPKFRQVKRRKTGSDGKAIKTAEGEIVEESVTRPEDIPADLFESKFWGIAIPWLLQAYNRICSYSCFRIHGTGTPSVDHMVPKSKAWDKVYEWSNYRLASLALNAIKDNLQSILDPFEVQPGWFALDLVTGQVVAGPAAKQNIELTHQVEQTIKDLEL
jgi:hypothetical protein